MAGSWCWQALLSCILRSVAKPREECKERQGELAQDLPSLWKSHPENEDELEDVVEREPVDGVDSRLKNGQEGIDNPVLYHIVSVHLIATPRQPHTVSH